jgi:translation initiation factor IF-3
VRLVDQDGTQIGIVSTQDALRRAQDQDLDLVEVAPQANPPVCRIMDYGKFKYERDVRMKEARKKQSRVEVKEIKMRPKIDPHDYGTKKGHVERFLRANARVKVTIMFRGRELSHQELGHKLMGRFVEGTQDFAQVEASARMEGRMLTAVLAPKKKTGAEPKAPKAPAAPAAPKAPPASPAPTETPGT